MVVVALMMTRVYKAVEDATLLYIRSEHMGLDSVDSALYRIANSLSIINYHLSEEELEAIKRNVMKRLERSMTV